MFSFVPSKWEFNVKFGIVEVISTTPLVNEPLAYEQTIGQVLGKMAELISTAEKFGGKSLESMPMPDCGTNTLVVSTAIRFKSGNDLIAFKAELPKIFKQG